ncbi:restriction endonuclease subunit S [Comamonas testosteroni]|uniref:restriction endonuclease subunit S n=1 Tax=Comamonas testosteroni TaxID=285 RepID=UPI0006A5F6FB|nr:restriction endonuclease subunit S [Comamonas testosteroni]KWT65084.1 Type I restriction-modification system, specificity subunit S [Comamonas testosteroni]
MSLQRYGEYKDCRVAWLGKLPTHWAVVRVKHVTGSIEQGWSPQCEGFPVETPDEWGVMKVGCVNGGRFRPSENKKLPVELQPMPQYALKRGDLLISRANTRELVGSAAVVQDDLDNLLLCDKLYRLRANEGMNQAKYLAYFLGTREARSQIELDATGASSSMLNIGQSAILDLLMPRPSAAEQAAITTFLDRETAKIDALIADQEKLITLLAEKRQATISHAVTKGLNPDVPMKDSGVAWLGEVPEHWDVRPLKFLAKIGNGSTPNRDNPDYWAEEGFPWLNSSVVNQEEVTEAERFVTEKALSECHLPVISPPAILVGITGQGKTRGMATQLQFTATVNQHLAYIKPIVEQLTSIFLLRCLESAYDHLRTESEGAGSTKGAITCDQLGRLRVPAPDLNEQEQIVSFLEMEVTKMDKLEADAIRAIALLKERRSALITAAVTGQIDVRNLAQEIPA